VTYLVVFQTFDAPQHCRNTGNGPWDYAANALRERNELFKRDATVRRCWINKMRNGEVIERYGAVLKREDAA
jgi:hypothetical protein